jgi:hypothetical protein
LVARLYRLGTVYTSVGMSATGMQYRSGLRQLLKILPGQLDPEMAGKLWRERDR